MLMKVFYHEDSDTRIAGFIITIACVHHFRRFQLASLAGWCIIPYKWLLIGHKVPFDIEKAIHSQKLFKDTFNTDPFLVTEAALFLLFQIESCRNFDNCLQSC